MVPGSEDTMELDLKGQGAAREPSALPCVSACNHQRPSRTRAGNSRRCALLAGTLAERLQTVSNLAREPERDQVTILCLPAKSFSGGLQGGG